MRRWSILMAVASTAVLAAAWLARSEGPGPAAPEAPSDMIISTHSPLVETKMFLNRCWATTPRPKVLVAADPLKQADCSLCRWELSCPVQEIVKGTDEKRDSNIGYTLVCGIIGGSGTTCPDFISCHRRSSVSYQNNTGRWSGVMIRVSEPSPKKVTMQDYAARTDDYERFVEHSYPLPNGALTSMLIRGKYNTIPDTYTCGGQTYCSGYVNMETQRAKTDPPNSGITLVSCKAPAAGECPTATQCLLDNSYSVASSSGVIDMSRAPAGSFPSGPRPAAPRK